MDSDNPYTGGFAVTPHATNPIASGTRAVYVGGAGTVVCKMSGSDTDVTFTAVAGALLPCRITHIRATSTATLMIALT